MSSSSKSLHPYAQMKKRKKREEIEKGDMVSSIKAARAEAEADKEIAIKVTPRPKAIEAPTATGGAKAMGEGLLSLKDVEKETSFVEFFEVVFDKVYTCCLQAL